MKLVDQQGRLFGRLNMIDAAIAAFVLLLVPLAYGSVLLFRPASPRITSVEVAPLTMTEDRAAGGLALAGKLKVRGDGLQPILRASIGDKAAIAFIFENPNSADVLFGDIGPGTHDLVLFDGVQEVARAPGAVTVPEKPFASAAQVNLTGRLVDLSQDASAALRTGAKFPATGEADSELVALGDPEPASYALNGTVAVSIENRWQRQAVVSVRCQIQLREPKECKTADGTLLAPGWVLAVPGTGGALRLAIDAVIPAAPPHATEMRVRFIAYPELIDLIKTGDRDARGSQLDGRAAVITGRGERRDVQGAISVQLSQEGYSVLAGMQAPDRLATIDAVLKAGLDPSASGWQYRNEQVRVGGPMNFVTRTYTVRGIILSMAVR